ncbi:MAG TPA: hypothetical protein VHA13_02400, partial [Gammaproteobacteria bacterium]|nr:hypothetical protein [Gammaproteobacteria bacterium]
MKELITWFSLASDKAPRLMFSINTSMLFLLITFVILFLIAFFCLEASNDLFNIFGGGKELYPVCGLVALIISLILIGFLSWFIICGLILNSVYKTRDEQSNFKVCFRACWKAKGRLFLVMLLAILIIAAAYLLKYVLLVYSLEANYLAYLNYIAHGTSSPRLFWVFGSQYAVSLLCFYLLLPLILFTVPLILTQNYKFG